MEWIQTLEHNYTLHIEPILDGMSNGEATLFGILLTALFTLFIWLGKQVFSKKSKAIIDKNNTQHGKQTTATKIPPSHDPAPHTESSIPIIKPLPHTSNTKLFGRTKELDMLTNTWQTGQYNIIVLKAMGGTGKTALMKTWLDGFNDASQRTPYDKLYTWSFYSQGSSEDKQASADEFFDQTLAFFDYQGEPISSAYERGIKLAELINEQCTLLVLDGLEPLQYPIGVMHGDLKDKGLIALLQQLAAQNQGLCLISSRQEVTELHNKPLVYTYNLEQLAPSDGVALLKKSYEVTGKPSELKAAVEELHGHALALNLLGNYLKTVYQGDIRQRDKIPVLSHERDEGNHAQHVMAAYEIHLKDSTALSILYMMGLFDRPASSGAIQCLRDATIAGLSDKLGDNTDWLYAVQDLRNQQLLNTPDPKQPDNLDTHPLIREYFGNRLKQTAPDAWQQAHQSLYEYYKALPDKQQPDTLEEMEPLFAAIAHGCKAGLYQQALDEVYYPRIQREGDNYLCNKLGAFGADLSALSHFFSQHWQTPAEALTDDYKAFSLAVAAFNLRALGRLQEAVEPMQAGLDMRIKQENWKNAATGASNLSELQLTRGELELAIRSAEQSVVLADKSKDLFYRMMCRTTLADALHQAGKLPQALSHFKTAEDLQQEYQADYPQLYSVRGFRYCDCLLSTGQWREVQQRVKQTLQWVTNARMDILSASLDQLSLGRANLIEWLSQYDNLPTTSFPSLQRGNAYPDAPASNGDTGRRSVQSEFPRWSMGTRENLPEYMPLDSVVLLGYANANPAYGKDNKPKDNENNPPNNGDKLQIAGNWLNQAVKGLRNSGNEDDLPLGLLARASFYRYCIAIGSDALTSQAAGTIEAKTSLPSSIKEAQKHALDDLQETHDTAHRSGMKLFLCDYHLESTRLALTLGETVHKQTAEQHLQQAEQLIKETGYKRRLPEVEYLKAYFSSGYEAPAS